MNKMIINDHNNIVKYKIQYAQLHIVALTILQKLQQNAKCNICELLCNVIISSISGNYAGVLTIHLSLT